MSPQTEAKDGVIAVGDRENPGRMAAPARATAS
jgi:hypothetical protein